MSHPEPISVSSLSYSRITSIRSGAKPAYFETQRHIIRTHAGNQYACKAHLLVGECLEVNVPDPADVRAVREAVVEQECQLVIALIVRDQVDDLIEAGRIL